MNIKKLGVFVMAILVAPSVVLAETTDAQVRTLFHLQETHWAGWVAVPDWTAEYPNLLVVAGPRWQDAQPGSTRAVELMAGFLRQGKSGALNRVADARFFAAKPAIDLYAETLYNFAVARATVSAYAVFPIGRLRVGLEAEDVFGRGRPDFAFGPRVALPWKCGPAKCAAAATYFIRSGSGKENVLRVYLPITF